MPERSLSVQSPFALQSASDILTNKIGKVFLVGAGPGDPGLITVRGAQCLSQADVVLYDGLANPSLLKLARTANLISVGKHGAGPLWSQDEINGRLIELAQAGHRVVRLKGGDPAVFARTAEELDAITAAGIPFEVVPGITAALAAASYVGIPITHRDHASAVAFITGQQQSDGAQELDWQALARFPGTLVFYMGVTTVGAWCERLIAEGKSPDTPAAIVRRCTWSDQRVIRCGLKDVPGELTPASKLRPPVIVIIGAVSALGQQFNWFDALPLRGQGVWLTRPAQQNERMAAALRELGAEVYEQPMLEIKPPEDETALEAAIQRLRAGELDGVAFTSRHAVEAVMQALWRHAADARVLHGVTIACVGDKTAETLKQFGVRPDIVPAASFNAESLLSEMMGQGVVTGQRWLLPQADQARESLAAGLIEGGGRVDRVIAYRSVPATELAPELEAAIARGAIDWVTVTSPSIARTLHRLLGQHSQRIKPLSLSPAISQVLADLGWPAVVQADSATEESLIESLLHWQTRLS